MQWGAVLPAGLLRIELFAFLIAATAFFPRAGDAADGVSAMRLPLALLTGLAILGLLQLIPLPDSLLASVSPTSSRVYAETNQILQPWGGATIEGRVSIAPAATRSATIFVAALVLLAASSARLLSSRRRRRTFLAVYLGSAVLHAVVSVSTFGPRTSGRIAGPFINPNHFSGWLEIAFACALGVLWREVLMNRDRSRGVTDRGERIEKRLLPIVLATLLVGALGTAIGLTKSRGGVAASTMLVAIMIVLALSHSRVRNRARTAILAAFMITLSIGFVVATAKREPVLRYLESDPREIAADTRVTLWATTLEAWQAYPIFGSGLGTFREAYRPHQPREIPQLVEQAHSDPLQILVTGGALGFLLAAGALVAAIVRLVRLFHRQRHREEAAFTLAGIGSLAVLAIHGLVEFNLSIPAIPATLACVAGFAFAAGAWVARDASSSDE